MNTPQKFSPELLSVLAEKLHPSHFPRMSRAMAAIVGFVVEADFTEPAIADIIVTSKGLVIVRIDGELSTNHMVGAYTDLLQNWVKLLRVAGLTTQEWIEAQGLFAAKVGFLGGEIA